MIATIVAVAMSIELTEKHLVQNSERGFYNDAFHGVFYILDETLDSSDAQTVLETEKKIRSLFKFPVSLQSLDDLPLASASIAKLRDGEMVLYQVDGADHLYKMSKHSDDVWVVASELNNYDQNVALVEGPINLIHLQLQNLSLAEQKKRIQEIGSQFSMPVTILKLSETELSAAQRTALSNDSVIAVNPGRDGEIYYKLIDNNEALLQLGPIEFPILLGLLPLLLTGFSLILMAAGCSFWLTPLWHDLRNLIHASKTIESGELSARVNSNSLSMIRPVMAGFNRMAARTEQTIESQQSLTTAVSHELRTPLARVKFSLEMARQSQNDTDRNRYMHNIAIDVDELNQLVEELLTYTRHDRMSSEFDAESLSNIDLQDWFKQQISRANRGLKNNITLNERVLIGKDEQTRIHTRLMSYAVSNGIANATRYARSRVDVSLERKGANYQICIDDDGPGISAELHESVFEPFHRLDKSRNRESGGFGLGLSIVKNIMRWHNGDASLATARLGGNRLTIRWPTA